MINLRSVLVLFGVVATLATGCVVEVGPGGAAASRSLYDSCGAGDTCGGGTSCSPVTFNASSTQGSLCTATCVAGSPCPSNGFCVIDTTGRGQCYRPCTSDLSCGFATVCRAVSAAGGGAAQICVPNTVGGAPVCGSSGQSCCSGNTCTGGLSCRSGVCTNPCGSAGLACCAGNVCGTGLACNGGTCSTAVTAYHGCTPAGSTCSDGTSCIQALARSTTTAVGNTCTAICPGGAASMCPNYVPGSVECVNVTGNPSMFQCVRLCRVGSDCTPFGTQCLAIMTAGGAPIQICAP